MKRGGSWNNNANNCTVSNRNNNNATNSNNNIGFRCVSIFLIRTCSARMAGHKKGKSRFLSCSRKRDKEQNGLHGLVALPNCREAYFFIAADFSASSPSRSKFVVSSVLVLP
ncbi:MAG TPA: hypothetical protein P5018_08430 [Rectinema sp.]|nr:hypothetical protein [bacterium]HRS32916.1 hypothetical protein [Rectinema sp.]HRU78588.1 hypothetical protein [Rectinema sp.]